MQQVADLDALAWGLMQGGLLLLWIGAISLTWNGSITTVLWSLFENQNWASPMYVLLPGILFAVLLMISYMCRLAVLSRFALLVTNVAYTVVYTLCVGYSCAVIKSHYPLVTLFSLSIGCICIALLVTWGMATLHWLPVLVVNTGACVVTAVVVGVLHKDMSAADGTSVGEWLAKTWSFGNILFAIPSWWVLIMYCRQGRLVLEEAAKWPLLQAKLFQTG